MKYLYFVNQPKDLLKRFLVSLLLLVSSMFPLMSHGGFFSVTYDDCGAQATFNIMLLDDGDRRDWLVDGEVQYQDASGQWINVFTLGYNAGKYNYNKIWSQDFWGNSMGASAASGNDVRFVELKWGQEGNGVKGVFVWNLPAALLQKGGALNVRLRGKWWVDWGSQNPLDENAMRATFVIIAPEMPSSLTNKVIGSKITFTWTNPNVACVSNKWIEYRKDNGSFQNIGWVNTFTDNASFGTTPKYEFRTAILRNGRTLYSNPLNSQASLEPALTSPGDVKVTQNKCGEINLSWGFSAGAKKYDVWRYGGGSSYVKIGSVSGLTNYADNTVKKGVIYWYIVDAVNDYQTVPSKESNGITTFAETPQPTNLTAVYNAATKKVDITWQYSSQVVSYNNEQDLVFVLKRGNTVVNDKIKAGERSISDPNVSSCTQYTYYLAAKTTCNTSPEAQVDITVPGGAIGNIAISASRGKYPNYVELKWNEVANTGKYRIFRNGMQLTTIDDAKSTSYLDMDAVPGDVYIYKVEATSNCVVANQTIAGQDTGYVLPNGKITGHIKTLAGNFVKDVELRAIPDDGKGFGGSVKLQGASAATAGTMSLDTSGFMIENWYRRDAPTETALNFDHTDNHLTIPKNTIGGDITIETWVNIKNFADDWNHIIELGNGQKDAIILAARQNGKITFYYGQSYPTFYVGTGWKHIAVTVSSSGILKFYLGGELLEESQRTIIPTVERTVNYIGRSSWNDPYLDAQLKEIRVWDVERTQDEIKANMNATLTGSESGLVMYYDFRSNLSTTVIDLAGGDQNATMANINPATDFLVLTDDTKLSEGTLMRTADNNLVVGIKNNKLKIYANKALVGELMDPKADNQWHHYRLRYLAQNLSLQIDDSTVWSKKIPNFSINSGVVFGGSTAIPASYIKGAVTKINEHTAPINMNNQAFTVQAAVKTSSNTTTIANIGGFEVTLNNDRKAQIQLPAKNNILKDNGGRGNDMFFNNNLSAFSETANVPIDCCNEFDPLDLNGAVVSPSTWGIVYFPKPFLETTSGGIDLICKLESTPTTKQAILSIKDGNTERFSITAQNNKFYIYNGFSTEEFGGVTVDNTYHHIVVDILNMGAGMYMLNIYIDDEFFVIGGNISGNGMMIGSSANSIGLKVAKLRVWNASISNHINTIFYRFGGNPLPNNTLADYLFTPNYQQTIVGSTAMTVNQWSEFKFSYDPASAQLNIMGTTKYIGSLSNSVFSKNNIVFDANNTAWFDEYRVWNTPNVTKGITQKLQGNEVGLLAYYPFDDNSGASKSTIAAPAITYTGWTDAEEVTVPPTGIQASLPSFSGWMSGTRIWNKGTTIWKGLSVLSGNEKGLLADYSYDAVRVMGNAALNNVPDAPRLNINGVWQYSTEKPNFYVSAYSNGDGNYIFEGVNYLGVKGRSFKILPMKPGHKFDPDNKLVTLDPTQTIVDHVDFTDLSTMPVSGRLQYTNTLCYEQNKEFLVDGQSAAPKSISTNFGEWDMSVEMLSHTFSVKTDTIVKGYDSRALNFPSKRGVEMGTVNLYNKSVTAELWFKESEFMMFETFLDIGSSADAKQNPFGFYLVGADIVFGWANQSFKYAIPFSDKKWHHLAASYDKDKKQLSLYWDGVIRSVVYPDSVQKNQDYKILLGMHPSSSYYFKGALDEFRLWDAALTEEQVKQRYNEQLEGDENGLLMYYNFDPTSDGKARNLVKSGGGATVDMLNYTDKDGAISRKPIIYTYKPVNTKYNPQDGVYKLFVDDPKTNLNFENTTTYNLNIKIRGNCNYSIGKSSVRITSTPECFDTLITNVDKELDIQLPPLTYNVRVLPDDKAKTIDAQQASLQRGDTALVFEYRTALKVDVHPSLSSQSICADKIVLEQFKKDTVEIETYEEYDGARCPIEATTILIYNDIGNKKIQADTLRLVKSSGGRGKYMYRSVFPSFAKGGAHPFQRKMDVVAIDTLDRRATNELWAYIKGVRPRPATFTSRMPSTPFIILRDPPGDMSYSYMEKSKSSSFTLGNMSLDDKTFGFNTHISLVPSFTMQVGAPGATTEIETEPVVQSDIGLNVTKSQSNNNEVTFTVTTTERFQTGDGEALMGEDADVYVGGALNLIFAPADELYFENCEPLVRTSIAASPDTVSTMFIYTGAHIKNKVIPYLDVLKADSVAKMKLKGASALQIKSVEDKFDADKKAWVNMLTMNKQLKEAASFTRNISFSSGTSYETSITVDTTKTTTIETSTTTDAAFMQSLGFYANGAGAQVDITQNLVATIGQSKTDENSKSTTTGYFLADNDPGDFFTVNIYEDPIYKTPVFKTLAGESKCPWEVNTQAREGLELQVVGNNTQSGVEEDIAKFQIELSNTSHNGDGSYVMIEMVGESNPNGCLAMVNGGDISSAGIMYYLPPYTPGKRNTIPITLAIAKGTEYDNPNLKIMAYSVCEHDIVTSGGAYSNRDGQKMVDTISVSVFYKRPCLEGLTIMDPKPNWVYNMFSKKFNNDVLPVYFTAPDLAAIPTGNKVDKFKFEYAPITSNEPLTVIGGSISARDLHLLGNQGSEYSVLPANIASINDNKYQIRMTAQCYDGRSSSTNWVPGSVFRTPPAVFGVPEPADGLLDAEDRIAIQFDKDIIGTALRPHNIKLLGNLTGVDSKPVSMSFDGLNDRAVLYNDSTTAQLFLVSDTLSFSVEFWMKSPGWTGEPSMVSNRLGDGPAPQGFSIFGQSDGKSIGAYLSTGTTTQTIKGPVVADNKWHHIALVVDELNSVAMLYVDLTEVSRASIANFGDMQVLSPMTLAATDNPRAYYRGNLDEVRYWNKAVQKMQLVRYWKKPLIGNEPYLVGCWRLDKKGTAPGFFFDITGNCSNGQMLNGAAWDEYSAAPIDYAGIIDEIPVTFTSFGNEIVLVPNIEKRFVEDVQLIARVNGVQDQYGNKSGQSEWTFYVNQNSVSWEVPTIEIVKLADSSKTFTVRLNNGGSSVEPFWLTQIPQWLTADVMQGSLAGFGGQSITFTIDKGVGNGDYSATLYAETKAGWEPLRVNLRVICPTPQEQVNPSAFEYAMVVSARLKIGADTSRDRLDVVRAYVGNELRGVGHIEYLSKVNDYRLLMTLYSNTTSPENFVFRIWDASACADYIGTQETISFGDNKLLGTIDNPVMITVTGAVEKTYRLKQGWNWVSFNVNPTQSSVAPFALNGFLNGNFTANDILKNQTLFSQYVKPNWTGTLTQLNNTQGYLLKAGQNTVAKAIGYLVPANTPVTIKAGWNLIGFPANKYVRTSEALTTIQSAARDGDVIRSQDEFAIFSSTNGWVGNLAYMIPGRGYMIKLSNDATMQKTLPELDFDIAEPVSDKELSDYQISQDNILSNIKTQSGWTVNAQAYPQSMVTSAVVNVNGQRLNTENLSVGAFVNGECRGVGVPVVVNNQVMFFMTIYGNNTNEQIYFKVRINDTDEVMFADNVCNFDPDQVLGNVTTPYSINLSKSITPVSPVQGLPKQYTLEQNQPNPFAAQTVIGFSLPEETFVSITVYNVLGAKVKTIVSGQHKAGHYNAVWDGLDYKGTKLPSGTYYYRLATPTTTLTKSLLIGQ